MWSVWEVVDVSRRYRTVLAAVVACAAAVTIPLAISQSGSSGPYSSSPQAVRGLLHHALATWSAYPVGESAAARSSFVPTGLPSGETPLAQSARVPLLETAWIGQEGKRLTVEFTGVPPGKRGCQGSYHLETEMSHNAVAVVAAAHINGGARTCTAEGHIWHLTTSLPSPIGARVLLDAGTEGVIHTALPASA